MALPVLGAAIMKGGAALAGKGSARSAAGSILSTGGSMKVSKEMTGLYNVAKESKQIFQNMSKKIGQIANILAGASPAFKQQLIIMNKSIQVFLRPIGDIMAKFVRPMAIWMLKFAIRWYDLFGTGGGEKDSPASMEDDLKQKMVELENLKRAGKGEGDPEYDMLIEDINRLNAALAGGAKEANDLASAYSDAFKNLSLLGAMTEPLKEANKALWGDFIPKGVRVLWESMQETGRELWKVFEELWNVLKPIIEPIWELVKFLGGAFLLGALVILTGAFKVITFVLKGVSTVLQLFQVGVVLLDDVLQKFGTWIKETFIKVWDALSSGLQEFGTWIKANFISIWDRVATAIKNAYDTISGIIDKGKEVVGKLKFWDEERSVGGEIPITGSYKLHAGERVLTAGQASSIDQAKAAGFTFQNSFFVTANLQNNMDIQELARLLSQYQEVEMRRRVSYI